MLPYVIIVIAILCIFQCGSQSIHESDINFRIDPGARTCFFEKGKAGQMMEAYYQVLDGQHGELDINFEIIAPNGVKLVSDYKRPQNSIIMDLTFDGDYVFCMDNTYSMMNSKLVFVSVVMENKRIDGDQEAVVSVVENEKEVNEDEVLEWAGVNANGEEYFIEVNKIVESLMRTLQHVVKARQLLDVYAAMKSRDSYAAFEDTFIVDVWSGFQISFMFAVGMLQVYMIKKLFNKPINAMNNVY